MNPYAIIEKYYIKGSNLYTILVEHSELVCKKALEVAIKHPELQLDMQFIEEASLLHDIGIYLCNSPKIECYGIHQYVEHGYLGSQILVNEGLPKHALVCERHTGVGLSLETIIKQNLPIPHRDMIPITTEEKVICYADKFYSKSHNKDEHSLLHIKEILNRHGEDVSALFFEWHQKFK